MTGHIQASREELLAKNRDYDDAGDSFWRLAVYEPVHDGWEFTNIGGRIVLDAIADELSLDSSSRVLELCSGLGATCRYLSSRYGCRATGVEMNANQVEHARAAVAPTDRLRFVHGDVTEFRPSESYDLVFTMDSLMLTPEVDTVLRNACSALDAKGKVMIAEIALGEAEKPSEMRELLWRMDGIASLLTPAEYRSAFARAGLSIVTVEDLTQLGHSCFRRIRLALDHRQRQLLEISNEATLANWKRMAEFYSRAFGQRSLLYLRIVAEAPAQA